MKTENTQDIINKIIDVLIENNLSVNEAEDILRIIRGKLKDTKITC